MTDPRSVAKATGPVSLNPANLLSEIADLGQAAMATALSNIGGGHGDVSSVAGRTGAVVLSSADLTDKASPGGVASLGGDGLVPITQLPAAYNTVAVVRLTIDGGGATPTTGTKGYIIIPYACTITKVTLLADQSGSAVLDIQKSTYPTFPTLSGSICAGNYPTISAAQKYQDATLTGWTKTFVANDILAVSLSSVSTITRMNVAIEITRS